MHVRTHRESASLCDGNWKAVTQKYYNRKAVRQTAVCEHLYMWLNCVQVQHRGMQMLSKSSNLLIYEASNHRHSICDQARGVGLALHVGRFMCTRQFLEPRP